MPENSIPPLETLSSLGEEKNPFAELSAELSHTTVVSQKKSYLSLDFAANLLRIIASIGLVITILLCADVFIRSRADTPSFLPASLSKYLVIGVESEANPNNLTISGLSAKYEADSAELLSSYNSAISQFAYKRSLVEFFEKSPEILFIRSEGGKRFDVLNLIAEFERMIPTADSRIKYSCKILTVSDAGLLKASCEISSLDTLTNDTQKSSRVAALEFLDTLGSSKSSFDLITSVNNIPMTEIKEDGYQTRSQLEIELRALPTLLP